MRSSQPGRGGVKRAKALVQGPLPHLHNPVPSLSSLPAAFLKRLFFEMSLTSEPVVCLGPQPRLREGQGLEKASRCPGKCVLLLTIKLNHRGKSGRREAPIKKRDELKPSNNDNKNSKPLELKEWPQSQDISFQAKLDNKAHLNSLNGCD